MKIVAAVFADFGESFLGGRSPLLTQVGSKTVIGHTLERLCHIEGAAERTLVVRPRDAAIAEKCLQQLADQCPRISISICDSGERPRAGLLRSARKWGLASWRGTPLGTTWFDEYIDPLAVARLLDETGAEGALCFSGCQPLLDPGIASRMIQHLRDNEADANFVFTQAPPGLAGLLLRRQITRELLENNWPFGLLLAYRPELPRGDLITRAMCCPVPAAVAQTQARFCADTRRSFELVSGIYTALGERANAEAACTYVVERFQQAPNGVDAEESAESKPPGRARGAFQNGPSVCSSSCEVAIQARTINLSVRKYLPPLPLEIEFELTTADPLSKTTLRPRGERVPRRQLSDIAAIERVFAEMACDDDSLLVLGGHGDPLQHPKFSDILRRARKAGICGISVTTPLVELSDANFEALFENRVDLLEVQIDAVSRESYLRVHGIDGYDRVIANIERIDAERRDKVCPQPLLVPSLTRCAATLPDQEQFFDSWIRRTGWSIIRGYSTFSERMPADNLIGCTPLIREGCRRLHSRLMLHADGTVPRCSQDYAGEFALGDWISTSLREIWQGQTLVSLRSQHIVGQFTSLPLCATCDEWFRP